MTTWGDRSMGPHGKEGPIRPRPPLRSQDMDRDLSEAGDAVLVVAIGRWRQDALAEVYRRHAGAVLAMARRILGDRERSEEVVQEVFVRLWNQPDRFDPDRGSLRSFLLAQAHGRTIDLLRADSARRGREERDARQAATRAQDVEMEVAGIVMAEQVRAALAALSEDERHVVQLAYFGGHSYREVARMLGQPEGTVKSRMRSALGKLRRELSAAGMVQP